MFGYFKIRDTYTKASKLDVIYSVLKSLMLGYKHFSTSMREEYISYPHPHILLPALNNNHISTPIHPTSYPSAGLPPCISITTILSNPSTINETAMLLYGQTRKPSRTVLAGPLMVIRFFSIRWRVTAFIRFASQMTRPFCPSASPSAARTADSTPLSPSCSHLPRRPLCLSLGLMHVLENEAV